MFDDLVLISGAFQKMNPGFRQPQIQKLFLNKRLISELKYFSKTAWTNEFKRYIFNKGHSSNFNIIQKICTVPNVTIKQLLFTWQKFMQSLREPSFSK